MTIKRSCIARICNPRKIGYISTIGVIDEIRRLGIGKILLDKSISILKMKKNCIGVYLHVIQHNKSAMNFYIKNQFCRGKYLENFYFIQKNYYDCIVFYQLFDNFKFKNPNENNKDKIDNISYHIIDNSEER